MRCLIPACGAERCAAASETRCLPRPVSLKPLAAPRSRPARPDLVCGCQVGPLSNKVPQRTQQI